MFDDIAQQLEIVDCSFTRYFWKIAAYIIVINNLYAFRLGSNGTLERSTTN